MQIKIPKSDKYEWTRHAQYKMQQYGLSEQRVRRVIKSPERIEEGIVPKTIAVMQRASSNKKSGEIWAMYKLRKSEANSKFQAPISKRDINSKINKNSEIKELFKNLKFRIKNSNQQIRIISAWRYPGVSPKNSPIPEEILREIKSSI